MKDSLDKLIAQELGMSTEIQPTVSVKDAWLVAEAIMSEANVEVLIRNCNTNRCGGIQSGEAVIGDFFCNVIIEEEEGNYVTFSTFAPTMPLAVSLSVAKYLEIIGE